MKYNLEDLLHTIIDKYLFQIGMFVVFASSLIIRFHLSPITMLSADYQDCLLPWVEYYRENGILKGLSETMGSYYVPYNLFLAVVAFLPGEPWLYIAGFSIICDYICAYSVYLISKKIAQETHTAHSKAVIAAMACLLLPASLLNGALWKQCDSVYSCFVMLSIYYALTKNFNRSLLMLGIGFIFKLQAIYLFPLFVILYILKEKNLRMIHFFWIPAMYLIGGLPAVFSGRRALDVYDVYYHQANYEGFDAMTIKMPNLYSFSLSDYPALKMPAILITLCLFVFMAFAVQKYGRKLSDTNLVYLAIWCLWTCILFLPAQHERYNFPVLLLLTAFYIVTDLKKCWPAIVINVISCFQYGSYLFKASSPNEALLAAFHMAAFLYVTYDLLKSLKEPVTPEPCEALSRHTDR
ncbi:MAG: hypothetical protein HFI46_08370 [Lachnospiraceae bacterium]|nr:hypothetical protein [Lachnospiraceae bacterium]